MRAEGGLQAAELVEPVFFGWGLLEIAPCRLISLAYPKQWTIHTFVTVST